MLVLRHLLGGEHVSGADLLLGFQNRYNIIKWDLGSHNALGVLWQKDLDFDSNDTLTHEDVTNGLVCVDLSGVTGLDHVSVSKFHGLGTLSAKLSSHNNFASLGLGLHDESHYTVTGTANGQSSKELELEGLGLGLGTESPVVHALGVQFHSSIGKVEALLNDRGEFANAAVVLTEDVLGVRGTDDEFGAVRGGADLDSGVSLGGQFGNQEFVQFSIKDTVGDELALGGDSFGSAVGHDGSMRRWGECLQDKEQGPYVK